MGNPPPPSPATAAADPAIDADLMRSIAEGNREALSALYDRYASRLLGLLVRMLKDKHDAEETLIDLFWEVWDRADRYDVSRGCVATYLMTLARSRAIDRRRRRTARPDTDPARSRPMDATDAQAAGGPQREDGRSPLAGVLFDEQTTVVRGAMEKLDGPQRQAIELAFFDGMSHSEIAESLGRPLGTVKTWIRQGLLRLADVLRPYS